MFNNSFKSVLPNMAMNSESKAWTHISWSFLEFLSSEKHLGRCFCKIWRFIFVFDKEHSGNRQRSSTLGKTRDILLELVDISTSVFLFRETSVEYFSTGKCRMASVFLSTEKRQVITAILARDIWLAYGTPRAFHPRCSGCYGSPRPCWEQWLYSRG